MRMIPWTLVLFAFEMPLLLADPPEELSESIRRGDLATIEVLLSEDPALLHAKLEGGSQPIHLAAALGQIEVLEALRLRGAMFTARDSQDNTPLHHAARTGQLADIIQTFQKLGTHRCGPSHCTGDHAIELFKEAYGSDFVSLGTGRTLHVPR